jgi:hypothetical protein
MLEMTTTAHKYEICPPPLLSNGGVRDGFQTRPLTMASQSLYNDAQESCSGLSDNLPSFAASIGRSIPDHIVPPPLHLRIETNGIGDLRMLSSFRNITKLALLALRKPHGLTCIDLSTLTSLCTLELIGYTKGGEFELGSLICPSLELGSLICPSLRELDLTRAGKGFSIMKVRCPELRLVKSKGCGYYGTNIYPFRPTSHSEVYDYSTTARTLPLKSDEVWKLLHNQYTVYEKADWEIHESCRIMVS